MPNCWKFLQFFYRSFFNWPNCATPSLDTLLCSYYKFEGFKGSFRWFCQYFLICYLFIFCSDKLKKHVTDCALLFWKHANLTKINKGNMRKCAKWGPFLCCSNLQSAIFLLFLFCLSTVIKTQVSHRSPNLNLLMHIFISEDKESFVTFQVISWRFGHKNSWSTTTSQDFAREKVNIFCCYFNCLIHLLLDRLLCSFLGYF